MTRDEIFKVLNWNQVLAALTGDKFIARIEALVAEAERREREAIIALADEMEVERTEYCMNIYEEGERYKSDLIDAILARGRQ